MLGQNQLVILISLMSQLQVEHFQAMHTMTTLAGYLLKKEQMYQHHGDLLYQQLDIENQHIDDC